MAATQHNIVVEQGSKFQLNVQARNSDGTVKDLTGYSGRMQVRSTVDSISTLMSATTGTGEITINAPGGMVMVEVGADVTQAMTWNVGVYDLEVFTATPANVIRLVEGFASLNKEVTR